MEVFKNEGYQFLIQTTESHYEFTQTLFRIFRSSYPTLWYKNK